MAIFLVTSNETTKQGLEKATGLTIEQLKSHNPGFDFDKIKVGAHLQVPGHHTTQYQIIDGDQGRYIAARLNISVEHLKNLNPNTNWENLVVGRYLTVPSGEGPSKLGTGNPVMGVPAQMPSPKSSQQTVFTEAAHDPVRKKVLHLFNAAESASVGEAVKSVFVADWVYCFAKLFSNITADQFKPAGGPRIVIVDVRDPNNELDKREVQWGIPNSLFLPCAEGKANSKIFDDAAAAGAAKADHPLSMIFNKWGIVGEVIFVDTHGHGRAPEIAIRYVQWLSKVNPANSNGLKAKTQPTVAFMAGGLTNYCNPQCFGRALIAVSINAFVTGWPKNLD